MYNLDLRSRPSLNPISHYVKEKSTFESFDDTVNITYDEMVTLALPLPLQASTATTW
jgi:hypothetical protein